MPRNADVVRPQGAAFGHAADLRDHKASVVFHADGLLQSTQISAFVFIREVAELIGRGGADDGDIWHDVREVQPGVAPKLHTRNDRRFRGLVVHRTALAFRVDEGLHAHLGQNAGPIGGCLACHVKQDARGHVIGGHAVLDDHFPDLGHGLERGPRRIRTAQNARQKPVFGDVVNAQHTIHIACGNRVDGRQIARMAFGVKPCADGLKHEIRAAQRRRGRHCDDRIIGNPRNRVRGADDFVHLGSP